MEEIKSFLRDKKNIATLSVLTLMLAILPLGIALIRQQQIYFSKAAGERIQIGTGRCVTEKDGKKVLTCTEVPLNLIAPFDPSANATPTPAAMLQPANNDSKMYKLSQIKSKLIPEAIAYDKHVCAGDTTPGVGGLIDIVVNGCGEALNYDQIHNSCVPAATIQYKPPLWNATKKEWETIKQDGKVISQSEMLQKSQQDGRFPIALSSTDNPPWINCEVYFEYSGRNDCNTTPQKNAAGQPMGRDGTDLLPGQQFTIDVAKTANPASGDPDCKQQVQVQVAAAATAPPTAAPTATATAGPQCTAGTFGSALMEIPNGCGTVVLAPAAGASSGVINYVAPATVSDLVCGLKVITANGGDCQLNSGGKGTANNPLKPGEMMNINYTNACTDNVSGCTLPIVISSAASIPTTKAGAHT